MRFKHPRFQLEHLWQRVDDGSEMISINIYLPFNVSNYCDKYNLFKSIYDQDTPHCSSLRLDPRSAHGRLQILREHQSRKLYRRRSTRAN